MASLSHKLVSTIAWLERLPQSKIVGIDPGQLLLDGETVRDWRSTLWRTVWRSGGVCCVRARRRRVRCCNEFCAGASRLRRPRLRAQDLGGPSRRRRALTSCLPELPHLFRRLLTVMTGRGRRTHLKKQVKPIGVACWSRR
jgi:hypothetical protein